MDETFARDIEELPRLFDFTGRFAARNALDETASYALNLAVEELFTNMVKYGADAEPRVSVKLAMAEGELVIEFLDHGADPFDVTQVPAADTTSPTPDRPVGRLGLHLVRNLMDGMRFERVSGDSRITLTKRLEG